MHASSIFNIRLDFEKSHDAYLFDKNSQRFILDLFGLYASLPLGYNHPIFKTPQFIQDYLRVSAIKVPNCEVITDEGDAFESAFMAHPSMKPFSHVHFCCTGALAIEAAIKCAIDQKGTATPMILSLKESFHGINGYGGFVTDRFVPVNARLDGLPDMGWSKLPTPKVHYQDEGIDLVKTDQAWQDFVSALDETLIRYGAKNIAAFVVEPIQATFGDSYFPPKFFSYIRQFCDQHGIALIFDEIQTGVGTTGSMWYFEQTGIIPDIVCFGKKLQVAGIMVRSNMGKTFQKPIRLEVTWDGSLCDMIRGHYVLKAYEEYGLISNAQVQGKRLVDGLKKIPGLKRVRGAGLFVAFDFINQSKRDEFFKRAFELGLMTNRTNEITVRLRPHMTIKDSEVDHALAMIKEVVS